MNFIDKELFSKYSNATRENCNLANESLELESKFRLKAPLKELFPDFESMPQFKDSDPNEEGSLIPEPKTHAEIIDRFVNLHGKQSFLDELYFYLSKYSEVNKEFLKAWLCGINPKIEKSIQPEFIKESFELHGTPNDEHIICRLINGYYETKPQSFDRFNYDYSGIYKQYGKLMFAEFARSIINENSTVDLSHRLNSIITYFKVEAKDEPLPTRIELKEKFGKNRETEFFSLYQPKSENHRPLKRVEIETILPYLIDYPNSLKLAKDKLNEME